MDTPLVKICKVVVRSQIRKKFKHHCNRSDAYDAAELFSNSLAVVGAVSAFWGVWLPNLIGLSLGQLVISNK